MKRVLTVAVLLSLISSFTFGQTSDKKVAQHSKAEQEVRQLMNDLEEAHKRGDVAFFNRVYADDYIATTPSGTIIEGKEKAMEGWKVGTFKNETYKYDDVRVCIYGGTAVVTNRLTREGKYNGQDN